ncbi:MAG: HU family DNA-binding protein [Flavobacteriales bacterium]
MAVTYTLVERQNPQNREAPKKYYAQAKSSGELTIENLSEEIAQRSTTVSDTDVLAVLNDLNKLLNRHLSDGRIVRFGNFGSFQISLSSEGAESEEKFNPSLIKRAKINFRPGSKTRDMLKTLKYAKV